MFQRCSSVEDAVQLTDVFQTELTCLMGTTGRHVVLVINPVTGVTLARVLSGLERRSAGPLLLPDAFAGVPLMLLLQFQASPRPGWSKLCRFYLSWKRAMAETAGADNLAGPGNRVWEGNGDAGGETGTEGKRRRS